MLRSKFKLSWTQALAEIVLIFIGITLAVTFNNWNENRKNNSLREGYYKRLLAIRLQIANTMTNLFDAVDNRCGELVGLIEVQIQE